jgi:two-component system, NtrC family, sensor histidine kinase PilS
MKKQLHADINVISRIKLLMIFRVAIVTFLLAVVVFIDIKGASYTSEISIPYFYDTLLAAYLFSVLYLFFYRTISDYRINICIQTFFDILIITAMVYVTGGIRSIYTVFYPLVIIYAVFFLGRNGGILSASGCSILYGLLIDFEYLGVIPAVEPQLFIEYSSASSYVFLKILVHIFSFYVIAAVASFVVEREKQTRVLLAEKESAFNRLDRLYRSIVESIDAGILTIDLEGRITSFNRGAEEITGFSFAEVEYNSFHLVFPSWANAFEQSKRYAGGELRAGRVEVPFTEKSNRRLTLGCSVSSLKETGGEKIGDIIIFQDLTRIKQMEEAVEKSKRLAFIGEMAASLAHELRNPLASISGSIQMLRRDLSLRVADERLMQIIIRGKDQLESFIKDFLLLARHKQQQLEETDLNLIINEVIESLRVDYNWHEGIEVEKIMTEPAMIYINKAEMRQVVLNLILNAIQAMPEGGKLTIETNYGGIDDRKAVEIKISDNGLGMDEESMKKIFEPFYTTKEKGTGLGLAIVNRIIEACQGEILVQSVQFSGTTFTVRLPAGKRE